MDRQDNEKAFGEISRTTLQAKSRPSSQESLNSKPGSISNARALIRTRIPSSPLGELARERQVPTLHSVYDLKSAIMALDSSAPEKDLIAPEPFRSRGHDENSKESPRSPGSIDSDLESETSKSSIQSVLKRGHINWNQISGQFGPGRQKDEDEASIPIFDGRTVSGTSKTH